MRKIFDKITAGGLIDKGEAMTLWDADLDELCKAADSIREMFCGDAFDICSIVNGKSGRCSENCKFCAQSAHCSTGIETYPLMDGDDIFEHARQNETSGMLRFSVVTSGRSLPKNDLDALCKTYRRISNSLHISLCASHGLLTEPQFRKLKEAGVTRYHNNLETSRRFFPSVCSTHSYNDKIEAVKAAQRAGLEVCSGGIIGLGETIGDRVDMILEIRGLGVRSIPVNILSPIPGTPFADVPLLSADEIRRTAAIFRFIVPSGAIRIAGGRGRLEDKGMSLFRSGANAAISGDMLTTSGISASKDIAMLGELGYRTALL